MRANEFVAEYKKYSDTGDSFKSPYPERADTWRGPHEGKELEMMLAGKKPAALVGNLTEWIPYIKKHGWVVASVNHFGNSNTDTSYVVGLPGEHYRVNKIAKLVGRPFPMDPPDAYHIMLGRLLGYDKNHIRKFIQDVRESSSEFSTDNPGGKWLNHEQQLSKDSGTTMVGAPKEFGSVTGYFSGQLLLPVDMLAKIPGLNNEQNNVRQDDLSFLTDLMGRTGKLPDGGRPGKEYGPFIAIDYSGTPWVNEGNHRIMAAKKLGWKFMPTVVRYFAGGEMTSGQWDPEHLLAMDASFQGKPRFKTA